MFLRYLLFQSLADLVFLLLIAASLVISRFRESHKKLPLNMNLDEDYATAEFQEDTASVELSTRLEQLLEQVACYSADYIFHSLEALTAFLTLILSVDRLYAILRPMRIKSFFTYLYPKRIVLLVYVIILAILAPQLFLNQYSSEYVLTLFYRLIVQTCTFKVTC